MIKSKRNHRVGEMFDERLRDERIGHLRKTKFIEELRECEEYFLELVSKRDIKTAYDVVANESINFQTIGYTEWGGNFLMYPLQYELRRDCIVECLMSPEPVSDWVGYYKQVLEDKNANKYIKRGKPTQKAKEAIVVLVGTNKLKGSVDIDKLNWMVKRHEGNIWFKPHPLTTFEYIGFLKDRVGFDHVLERDEDLFYYVQNSDKVYTTHFSESLIYASILGKETEPVDLYETQQRGGFSHISNFLFKNQFNENYEEIINRVFSCSRSGIINPRVEPHWKEKMEMYVDYILAVRENYKFWYKRQRANKNIQK